MPLLLNVPYEEKEEAKKCGARWNPELKKWYVQDKRKYKDCQKWFMNGKEMVTVVHDFFYLIEGRQTCYKCHKETRVIGFGLENYTTFYEDERPEYETEIIHITSEIEPLPKQILAYIQKNYNYKETFSKTIQDSYLANCCDQCNSLQGNFFLFNEVESPFFIDSKETASKLKLYKISLKNDLVLENESIGYGSEDAFIKEYGTIIPLEINIEP